MFNLRILSHIALLCILHIACQEDEQAEPRIFDLDYMSHIYPENFVSTIDNPFLPLSPGSEFIYTSEGDDGTERVVINVLGETRLVMGITCTVVRDRNYLDNELVEETFDWYAQDKDGNVWYMGEAVDNYVDGVLDNHYGSWEAGVDGAEPGIVMLANPVIGLQYRQEHYIGQAEDRGKVVAKDESVTVSAGTFDHCLKIEETNPLDKGFLEYKYYARGIGLVKAEVIEDPVEIEQLTSYNIK
jgi:hypothetical protein